MWRGMALVIGASLALAGPARAGGDPADVLAKIRRCDRSTIARVAWDSTLAVPGHEELAGFRTLDSVSVSGHASRRIASLVARGEGFSAGSDCALVCLDCPDGASFILRFGPVRESLEVDVHLRERRVYVLSRARLIGHRRLEADAGRLLALIQEAFPRDSAVWAMRLTTPPARDGSLPPRAGEYQYVEEPPQAVETMMPQLPYLSGHEDIEGTVILQALVGTDGRVVETKIVHPVPFLDHSCTEAMRQWRFQPALCGGQPVPLWITVPIKFTLR